MKKTLILKAILLNFIMLSYTGTHSFSNAQMTVVNEAKASLTLTCMGEVEEGMDVAKLTEKENFLFFDSENQMYYLVGKSAVEKLQAIKKAPKNFKVGLTDYVVTFTSKSAQFEDNGTIYHELLGVTSIAESTE